MKWIGFLAALLPAFFGFSQSTPDSLGPDVAQLKSLIAECRKNQWIDSYRSLELADRALLMAQRLGNKEIMAQARNQKGFAFWSFGDNELAIEEGLDALQLVPETNFALIQSESYYVLARAYMDVGEQEKAWESLKKAESLATPGSDWELLCSLYNLMGVVQFIKHDQDSALKLYTRAYELGKLHSVDSIHFPRIISNIGECYAVENPALAFSYYRKALELANQTGNQIAKASITAIIGHEYIRSNDLKKAEANLQEALALAQRLGLRRVIRHAYSGLVDIKLKQGKGSEAVVYQQKYYQVRDSLLNTSKMRQIVELENRHAMQLQEKNIQLLEDEKRLETLWKNVLIGLVAAVLIASFSIYRWQRYRYRKNREMLDLEIDYLNQRSRQREDQFKATLAVDSSEPVESQDQKVLRTAIQTVEQHIDDTQFSVEKMADLMNMSRTSLHRKIKSISGFPPSELIRSIRLRTAARLIQNKADTVSQIALRVGFDDYSHFSKSFKKHFGVSPTLYEESAGRSAQAKKPG